MSGSSGNLTQVVNALQSLVQASYLSEQQLSKIVLAIAGALAGPVVTTATAGSATLPSAPVGFATVSIGGTTYKVALYNT